MKKHTQNAIEKLFPDPFLKDQNWVYLYISSVIFHTVGCYCMPSWGLSKYIEIKQQTVCLYLKQSLFKETKGDLELQSFANYLRLTLVFVWNSVPQEKFNHYFSGPFC